MESLHKHLNKSCLPECYGGTLDVPRISGPQWYDLLLRVEKEFDGTYFNIKNTYKKKIKLQTKLSKIIKF